MSLFTATSFWNVQPVEIAPAGGYQIRTDAYASYVVMAVPGTQFGSTFSQPYYYSDISAAVRGTGSNINLIASSSGTKLFASSSLQVASGSGAYDFSSEGYTTSIFQEDQGSIGAASSTEFNFSNSSFVCETWVYMSERLYIAGGPPFHKSFLRGTTYRVSMDISFVSNNSPLYRMRTIINDTQYFSGNIASNLNAWYHVAWVRSGNNLYWYWGGTKVTGPTAMSSTVSAGTTRIYGGDLGANDGAKGNFQDSRVSIGTDRGYTTTTITPPNSIVEQV